MSYPSYPPPSPPLPLPWPLFANRSGTLYFGWMLVLSYLFAIMTGTVGFLATFLFVRMIYSALKVD